MFIFTTQFCIWNIFGALTCLTTLNKASLSMSNPRSKFGMSVFGDVSPRSTSRASGVFCLSVVISVTGITDVPTVG